MHNLLQDFLFETQKLIEEIRAWSENRTIYWYTVDPKNTYQLYVQNKHRYDKNLPVLYPWCPHYAPVDDWGYCPRCRRKRRPRPTPHLKPKLRWF